MAYEVRNEYYRAAKRHLAVCLQLQNNLLEIRKIEDKNSSLNKGEIMLKDHLLTDLYYLAGYVIECTYCMVIFHHFPKIKHKKTLVAELGGVGKKNISFRSKINENPETCIIADGNHRLGGFQKVFGENYLKVATPINLSVFNKCQNLFDEWEAEVRYNKAETEPIKFNLTINQVFDFLSGAKAVFNACKNFHPETRD